MDACNRFNFFLTSPNAIKVNSYQNTHTRETLTLEYVNCLMKFIKNFPDQLFPGKQCAQQVGLENWEVIEACANQTEGSKLLQKNGEYTQGLNPPLTSVPTITFRYVSANHILNREDRRSQ